MPDVLLRAAASVAIESGTPSGDIVIAFLSDYHDGGHKDDDDGTE